MSPNRVLPSAEALPKIISAPQHSYESTPAEGASEETMFNYKIIVRSAGGRELLAETLQCPSDTDARQVALCLLHHGAHTEIWRDGELVDQFGSTFLRT